MMVAHQPPAPPEAPEIEVTLAVKLSGSLATIEEAADLAATLDQVFTERYPETYTGMGVRLDVTPKLPGMIP
jgi:hypothetical protein